MRTKLLFVVFLLMIMSFFICSYIIENFCISEMDELHTFIHHDKIETCYMMKSYYYALRFFNWISFILSFIFGSLIFSKRIIKFWKDMNSPMR